MSYHAAYQEAADDDGWEMADLPLEVGFVTTNPNWKHPIDVALDHSEAEDIPF
jgi:hypothetical protein